MALLFAVGFFLAGFLDGNAEFLGFYFMVFGLIGVLLTGFSWVRIIDEYDFSTGARRALKILNYISGILGIIILVIVGLFSFITYMEELGYDGAEKVNIWTRWYFGGFFAITTALIFNALLRNFPSLFPSLRESWPRIFFEDYGFMILLPVTFVASIFLVLFSPQNTMYVLMLIWNFVAIFFFLFLKCRYEKVFLGYILIGVTAFIDLVAMIFYANEYVPVNFIEFDQAILSNPTVVFQFTSLSYFILALIIAIPFYAIVEKAHEKLSRDIRSIVYFVVPFVAFGLQILMYHFWWVALLCVAAVIGITFIIALFTPPSYRDYIVQDSDGDYYILRKYF
jgi:hypothetical protein